MLKEGAEVHKVSFSPFSNDIYSSEMTCKICTWIHLISDNESFGNMSLLFNTTPYSQRSQQLNLQSVYWSRSGTTRKQLKLLRQRWWTKKNSALLAQQICPSQEEDQPVQQFIEWRRLVRCSTNARKIEDLFHTSLFLILS